MKGAFAALGAGLLLACAPKDEWWIDPPWGPDAVGFVLALSSEGQPLSTEVMSFAGYQTLDFEVELTDGAQLWAETYLGGFGPRSGCTPTLAEGEELPAGTPWSTGPLEEGEEGPLQFQPTTGPRPTVVRATCPAPVSPCERVSVTITRPDTGTAGVDLYAVVPAGPGRWWVGGAMEQTGSFLGILEEDRRITRLHVEGDDRRLVRLEFKSGIGYWAGTASPELRVFDQAGALKRRLPMGGLEVSLLDDGSAYALEPAGTVRRFANSTAPGARLPGITGLRHLVSMGDRLLGSDDTRLWTYGEGVWTEYPGPPASVAGASLRHHHGRIVVYGPSGTWYQDLGEGQWHPLAVENVPLDVLFWDDLVVVVDAGEQLLLYDGRTWCRVADTFLPSYRSLALSPDEQVLMAVGTNRASSGNPLVTRLERGP